MGQMKSPSLDGFHPGEHAWKWWGGDLTTVVCLGLFNGDSLVAVLNDTHIVLIPYIGARF